MRTASLCCVVAGLLCVTSAAAQEKKGKRTYPPDLPGAKVEVYKTIGDTKLNLYIYEPKGHQASDKTPAIVFFFGGGWTSGSPTQFEHHCQHLPERGMVAITADYRVASRNQNTADECVKDAKAAMRWIRQNALKLGIDANRVAAGGGSAGGHLAAAVATLPEHDDSAANYYISPVPNALALFNPAVVLAPAKGFEAFVKADGARVPAVLNLYQATKA